MQSVQNKITTQPNKVFQTQIQIPYGNRSKNNSTSSKVTDRVKQLREHARQLDFMYKRALSEKVRTTKSISLLNRSTQKIRVDFLKFYETKKSKLLSQQKLQKLQIQSKEHLNNLSNQVRQKKLLEQLQAQSTKNEQQENNQLKHQLNKREKQHIKKEIKLKNMQSYMYAKSMYTKIKEEKSEIVERNKKISNILAMRSHLNYAQKMGIQLQKIHQYEDLLKEIEGHDEIWGHMRPVTSHSKSFFITTRSTKRVQ